MAIRFFLNFGNNRAVIIYFLSINLFTASAILWVIKDAASLRKVMVAIYIKPVPQCIGIDSIKQCSYFSGDGRISCENLTHTKGAHDVAEIYLLR